GLQVPVLDLENEQAAGGVEDQEVGVLVAGPDGDVEPAEVVVLQEVAETVGEAALAGGGAAACRVRAGEESRHARDNPCRRPMTPEARSHSRTQPTGRQGVGPQLPRLVPGPAPDVPRAASCG